MPKKILYLFLLLSISFSQQLSNSELEAIKNEIRSRPASSKSDVDIAIDKTSPEVVRFNSSSSSNDTQYFGYNYFQKDINFFDNIPSPPNYKLGAGDEIILSIWGDINSRENFIINKEGFIFYQTIGFINLQDKTIEEAEALLVNELSSIYSSINDRDGSTNLNVQLGKLKSINIYFSGQVRNPGIKLIHPFSDVYTALIQSGGVKQSGSLRNIQLIRDNEMISTFDFYSFFINGKNMFSDIRLLDGDTIFIPTVEMRANIAGAVFNPGFYEFKEDENLIDIIKFTGGLTAGASTYAKLDILLPPNKRKSNDNARKTINISSDDYANTALNSGDRINILPIEEQTTQVEVVGRVKSPGFYGSDSTLKEVLEIAGGFNDPSYIKSIRADKILVLRKDETQVYSKEFTINYEESDKFKLIPGDKILVYTNQNYLNNLVIKITGQVNKPGTYTLKRGMTVGDVINLAEGFTEFTTEKNIIVREQFTVIGLDGKISSSFGAVSNVDLDFILGLNSEIDVYPYENLIKVQGNVYDPGLIAYSKNIRYKDVIELAGGFKSKTLKRDAYIVTSNGERYNARNFPLFRGKKINPGDTIFVPRKEDREDLNVNEFVSNLSTTLSNLLAILIVLDRTN